MKILIISDTHGRNNFVYNTIRRVSPIDLMIHLGDFDRGEEYIKDISPCPALMISGNNDFYNGLPREIITNIGNYTVMLTHGHRYGVNYSTNDLLEAAKRNQANIVMYGHTHVPLMKRSDGIWIINPGSLGLPRQNGRESTFIIMEIDEFDEVHFSLNYYKEEEEE